VRIGDSQGEAIRELVNQIALVDPISALIKAARAGLPRDSAISLWISSNHDF